MRITVKLRLFLIFIPIIVLSVSLVTTVHLWFSMNRMEIEFRKKSAEALEQYLHILMEYEIQAENIAELIAGSEIIRNFSKNDNVNDFLEKRQAIWFTSILEIFDKDRRLIARAHSDTFGINSFFTSSGDEILNAPLNLKDRITLDRTPEGISIKATKSIIRPATIEVLGVVVVTFPLNVNLLQKFKERINAELTLQWNHNEDIVTTFQNREGLPLKRIWKSAISDIETLNSDVSILNKKHLNGALYTVAYTNLKNLDGEKIGILSTAVNSSAIQESKKNILSIFLISSIVSVIFALIAGYLTAGSVTKPIYELLAAIQGITAGNLKQRAKVNSRDEIGDLADAFNIMTESLDEKQESLKKAEEKYRNIFENAIEGIFQTTLEGGFIDANPSLAKILGYKNPEELISSIYNFFEHFQVDPEKQDAFRNSLIEKGHIFNFESEYYRKDGKKIWFSVSARTVFDKNGKPKYFEGFLVDISERKEKEEARRQRDAAKAANEAKTMFLATMSHEIRTPMNAVLGFAELLLKKSEDERQKQYLNIILSSGRKLVRVINDILDLSKIEAGKLKLQLDQVDIRELVNEIAAMFSVKIQEKGIDIKIETDPNLPRFLILDPVRIQQILFNLVGNSIKFTEAGFIRIKIVSRFTSSTKKNIDLILSIQDTGVGIPENKLESIFDSYSQVTDKKLLRQGGSGLGLTITKHLTKLMNGNISVESEPGKGTSFTLIFRNVVVSEDETDEKKKHTPISEKISFQKTVVLITDDNEYDRELVKNFLDFPNLYFLEAENGKEAIEKAKLYLPDLILMDLKMPVMDGYEAMNILKHDNVTKNIPILAVTASAMKTSEDLIMGSGCDEFLTKPVSELELVQTVARLIPHEVKDDGEKDMLNRIGKKNDQFPFEHDFPETPEKRKQLRDILEEQIKNEWEQISDIFFLDEIVAFGEKLIRLGEESELNILHRWGSELRNAVTQHDIDRIISILGHYTNIRDNLDTSRSKRTKKAKYPADKAPQ